MAARRLPPKASLDHLRNESRKFQRLVRTGDPDAVADLRDHHPKKLATAESLALADAQHVVARRYGFPSWNRLRAHLEEISRFSRMPGAIPEDADPVDRFLRLACLTYGSDDRRRHAEARELLTTNPEVGSSNIYAMAAAGEVEAARALLARDPGAASREGGPYRWVPLLYATYSRVEPAGPGRSTLEVARLLLEAGADPNAGYLWDGVYPFTALTGAIGGGENSSHQPPHHDCLRLARLLLEAGADPNDTQALYNRLFRQDDDHLELLFEFGLGREEQGPWAARLGPDGMSIAEALAMVLQWAAEHDQADRVRLLLDHGVDPSGQSGHPGFEGLSPIELAERSGNDRIVDMLAAAGAEARDLGPTARLVAACLRGDRATATAIVEADPEIVPRAQEEHAAMQRAGAMGRREAVELMVDLGFDINAVNRTTALHEAAAAGHLDLVQALIRMGADPSIRDTSFDATPVDWAAHEGQAHVVAYLAPLTPASSEPD